MHGPGPPDVTFGLSGPRSRSRARGPENWHIFYLGHWPLRVPALATTSLQVEKTKYTHKMVERLKFFGWEISPTATQGDAAYESGSSQPPAPRHACAPWSSSRMHSARRAAPRA